MCCGTSRKQILLYPVPKKMPPCEAEHWVERQEWLVGKEIWNRNQRRHRKDNTFCWLHNQGPSLWGAISEDSFKCPYSRQLSVLYQYGINSEQLSPSLSVQELGVENNFHTLETWALPSVFPPQKSSLDLRMIYMSTKESGRQDNAPYVDPILPSELRNLLLSFKNDL